MGWKVMPVEATQEMLDAPLADNGDVTLGDLVVSGKVYESRRDLRPMIWRTMAAAAPPPATEQLRYEQYLLATAVELIKAIAPMAKNDAMIMEAMSRHQPVPGTETAAFGDQADEAMRVVNRAYAFIGLDQPFWEDAK